MHQYAMKEESFKFLREYINNSSPTGKEVRSQKLWLDYIRPYIDKAVNDVYGSVAAIINPDAKYKVVLEAHVDQVAFYVNYISKDGYIYVTKIGGSVPVIAPSKRVKIKTEHNGIVKGIFAWPAPHVKNSKAGEPSIDNIFVETGCSSKEEVLELGIEVGNIVVFEEEFEILNNHILTGPSLDNSLGGFALAEIARLLKENNIKLPFGLYLVNSVQEEVGKNGALLMANNILPDVALIIDATHDTQSPMYNKKEMGDIHLGKGPVFTYSPTVQNNLLSMLKDVAKKNDIPVQRKTAGKSTGTDADVFAYSDSGVATALISFPLKYMHTTLEVAHQKDIQQIISLLYNFLTQLKAGHNFKYFDARE
jgi:tetrahedral aminopeptidase